MPTSRFILLAALLAFAASGSAPAQVTPATDPAALLVARLDLERYKAAIRGLAQFGDRREGTARNRAALDWIEAELRSYGCADPERHAFSFEPPAAMPEPPPGAVIPGLPNENPDAQPDPRLRALNAETPHPGPREQIYCTKRGAVHPDEMYIVSAHFDGTGYGEAANDDASGVALVLELARILNMADVRTERSVRFILFNSEELGMIGSRAYVEDRRPLLGREIPAGSGLYPEPRWLGIIQHDMMLFDHGMPLEDGIVAPEQRFEADLNIEFQMNSAFVRPSQDLAWALRAANEAYAGDYPASVGNDMVSTDSMRFQNFTAAVSLRENERGREIGAGWNPHWHQPSDVYAAYSDEDFLLGLNAAQTSLGAVARLAGASVGD